MLKGQNFMSYYCTFISKSFEIFATCTKILQKIMTFQKLPKTHFGQYLVYFSKQYYEISGKTYCHGNDITNTTSS